MITLEEVVYKLLFLLTSFFSTPPLFLRALKTGSGSNHALLGLKVLTNHEMATAAVGDLAHRSTACIPMAFEAACAFGTRCPANFLQSYFRMRYINPLASHLYFLHTSFVLRSTKS